MSMVGCTRTEGNVIAVSSQLATTVTVLSGGLGSVVGIGSLGHPKRAGFLLKGYLDIL